MSVAALMLSVFLSGCTRHPNEDQCQAFVEQQEATNAAEQLLQDKKQEQAKAEDQLKKAEQLLEDAKSEKEKVASRLGDM